MAAIRITRLDDAPGGGCYLAFACADSDQFYRLVAAIKALGRCDAQWEPDEAAWWVSPHALAVLCARYGALADATRAYRGDAGEASGEATGGASSGSSRAGGKTGAGGSSGGKRRGANAKSGKSAPPAAIPAKVAAALAALYVTPDAPVEVVKAAYKALAKVTYPYVQGAPDEHVKTERMKRLNLAYEEAEAWAGVHGAQIVSAAS